MSDSDVVQTTHVVDLTCEATADARWEAVCERGRQAIAEATEDDLRRRYSAALIAKEVMADATFGEGRVEKWADEVGQDKSTVYKWIKVAEAFDEVRISDVLESKDTFGRSLSWSQVALCASVPDQATALLEQALRDRPSVADLKKIVAAARSGSKKRKASSINRAVKDLEKHLTRAMASAELIRASGALSSGDGKNNENIAALCRIAVVYSTALPAALKAVIDHIEPRPGLKSAESGRNTAEKSRNSSRRTATAKKRRSAA